MVRNKWWTREEERKLADMTAAGMSPEAVAKELGRPVLGVERKAKRMGLTGGGKGRGRRPPPTTGELLSSGILTHEQVLEVLAGALEKAKEPGLDRLEINRLSILVNLARTYDSILEKFERWVEIEERIRQIEQRLVAAGFHEN